MSSLGFQGCRGIWGDIRCKKESGGIQGYIADMQRYVERRWVMLGRVRADVLNQKP